MNDGRRLRNAGLVLAVIFMVAAYLAVSGMGLTDLQNDITHCQEMMGLWEITQGEFGWPLGTCDAIN